MSLPQEYEEPIETPPATHEDELSVGDDMLECAQLMAGYQNNAKEYAGGAIEDAIQLNAAQLSQIPGLVPPRPPLAIDEPKRQTKCCGCPIPDITCDCSKVRSCGCPKELPDMPPAAVAAKPIGNIPASMLASNRRKLTDTFLTASDKSQTCGSYRLTPFNPSGPKYRIRRKLGGGFAITSGLDDTAPADGNYHIITPTEKLPGRYVIEVQPNGAYVIQNCDDGPPLTKLEEGDYTLLPVHIVPIKTKESGPAGTSSPSKQSEVDKTKEQKDAELKTNGSKGSKTSQGSKELKTSAEDEAKPSEENKKQNGNDDAKPPEENKTEAESKPGATGSEASQEVAATLPDKAEHETNPEQNADAKKTSENNKSPEKKSPNLSEEFNPQMNSTFMEKQEKGEPSAYFVSHTPLPGMYKLNYCDTRPNMGPRPIPDGIYPLWDRDASGNSTPSNRSDGVYTLEWVELEIGINEQNMFLPQPVSERVVSVTSESNPDGSNVTTVTRKTTACRQVTLNAIYPGGRPVGMQKVDMSKIQSICACSAPKTDYRLLNISEECSCSPPPPPEPVPPKVESEEDVKCTCNSPEISECKSPTTISKESKFDEGSDQHELNCPCSKLKAPKKPERLIEEDTQDGEGCITCLCGSESPKEPTRNSARDHTRECTTRDSTKYHTQESPEQSMKWHSPQVENQCPSTRGQSGFAQMDFSAQQQYPDEAFHTLDPYTSGNFSGTGMVNSTMYDQSSRQGQYDSAAFVSMQQGTFGQTQDSSRYNGSAVNSSYRDANQSSQGAPGPRWISPGYMQQGMQVAGPQFISPQQLRSPTPQNMAAYSPQPQNTMGATPRWFAPQPMIQQPNFPGYRQASPNQYYGQPSNQYNPMDMTANTTARSGKQVQTIKPKQALQVQPGINIVRRDNNEDVDIVVEMEVDEDATADSSNSQFNPSANPEPLYCGDADLEEEELSNSDPTPERLSKIEESITVEAWRQGMLVKRLNENERALKHVMDVVATLQNDMTSQLNASNISPTVSPFKTPTQFAPMARSSPIRTHHHGKRLSVEDLRRSPGIMSPISPISPDGGSLASQPGHARTPKSPAPIYPKTGYRVQTRK